MTMVFLAVELMYFLTFANRPRKDNLLTKTCVLVIVGLILVTGITAYNFVCKPDAPYLANDGATLWDTQTEQLTDEICAGYDTDAEKVQAIYQWIILNFEYDYDYHAFIQYFDVRKTLRTHKGVCYDFSNLFAALCRSQNIPCYVVDGAPYDGSANHTWNHVYYNGSWWDVDVTNDTTANKGSGIFYGFHKLESAYATERDYRIMKIY
jgi:transglutaminase-like putative cysteine protease